MGAGHKLQWGQNKGRSHWVSRANRDLAVSLTVSIQSVVVTIHPEIPCKSRCTIVSSASPFSRGLRYLDHVFSNPPLASHNTCPSPRPLLLFPLLTAPVFLFSPLRRSLCAVQVHAHFEALARCLPHIRVDLLTAASATPPARQVELLLQRQAEVLVATPGRLLRLLKEVRPCRK